MKNRGLLFITFVSTAALLAMQACSSDETTATSDGGTSSSGGTTNNGSSGGSSGDTTSSGGEEDTCVAGGGACVCGGDTTPCPTGGTRDPALKCKQGPQGSGQCFRSCCKGGDSGPPPNEDAAPQPDGSGATDASDSG